jgi:hypothetical protein
LINLAVSEKLSALVTEKFLGERAKRANREKFLKVLKDSPTVEPEEFDKL